MSIQRLKTWPKPVTPRGGPVPVAAPETPDAPAPEPAKDPAPETPGQE